MNTLLALIIYAFTVSKTMMVHHAPVASSVRSERSFSLTNRYPIPSVSDVFRDNILLTLAYMNGRVSDKININWSDVQEPQSYTLTLNPGEIFAFHEKVLPEYQGKIVKTMNAHFNWADGFKSDGWLTGDGVCHLASLMYMAARDAGLLTYAPTNHDFANIPEVPKQYGVAIYMNPTAKESSARQNLYITNTLGKPVQFAFAYDGTRLTVKIID